MGISQKKKEGITVLQLVNLLSANCFTEKIVLKILKPLLKKSQ